MAAADLNQVSIVGRATKDPEMRGGGNVLSIRLAFSSRQKDRDGTWEDKSNFVDVVVFGNRAEGLEPYISKGSRIGVAGRLDWREWETDDGGKRQALQIIANDVQLLDGRDGGGNEKAKPVEPERAPLPDDDDIPF